MAGKNGRRDLEKEQFWRQTIARQRKSGQTVREFCEAEGLKDWSLSWWRRELVKRDREKQSSKRSSVKQTPNQTDASPFVPVQLLPDHSKSQTSTAIEIVLSAGQTVRVPSGFDSDALTTVLEVLETRSC